MPTSHATDAVPFNPAMLRWAREWSERSAEEAAHKVGTKPENVLAWESGDGAPTVRQARVLANFYGRAFLEFFLAEPPQLRVPELVPDFRMHRHVRHPGDSKKLREIQMWAEAMRENALDLFEAVGETPPRLSKEIFSDLNENPDHAAKKARANIGPNIDQQLALSSQQASDFPKILRSSLEAVGILVLREGKLSKLGVRGVCLYDQVLPVIVFGAEAPAAQSFTLVHELAHVALRQSAISGSVTEQPEDSRAKRIEDWCNRFAAAYLIPEDVISRLWARPNSPVAVVGDDDLQRLAGGFKVSRHAMLIRLVHLNYVSADFYWNVKKIDFESEEKDYKSFGRSKYYGSRFRNACGDLYTGLVLDAWSAGAITGHNATEYLGTKSFRHLEDIRREFVPP